MCWQPYSDGVVLDSEWSDLCTELMIYNTGFSKSESHVGSRNLVLIFSFFFPNPTTEIVRNSFARTLLFETPCVCLGYFKFYFCCGFFQLPLYYLQRFISKLQQFSWIWLASDILQIQFLWFGAKLVRNGCRYSHFCHPIVWKRHCITFHCELHYSKEIWILILHHVWEDNFLHCP